MLLALETMRLASQIDIKSIKAKDRYTTMLFSEDLPTATVVRSLFC
jgi:hypothetical protein